TLLLAFALFYYTTRAPRMVAGMVGEDLSSSIESLTKKGISGAWGLGKQQKLSMVRRKQLDEDRKEKGLPTGFSGAKQRFNLRKKYVGIGGLVTGVSPDEIDKAEKEAHAAAETELDVVSHANFPHRSVIPRKVAHEKQSYQLADETAGMFSRGKLTNARENTSLVDGRYGYTLDNLDATGKTKKQHY